MIAIIPLALFRLFRHRIDEEHICSDDRRTEQPAASGEGK
jgi:hypothetical protein